MSLPPKRTIMSTSQHHDAYGRPYRQASHGSYSHSSYDRQHDQASDPYHTDARTAYGPYDPRYPYGQPEPSQGHAWTAQQSRAAGASVPAYDQPQQQSSYDPADRLDRMHIYDQSTQSAMQQQQQYYPSRAPSASSKRDPALPSYSHTTEPMRHQGAHPVTYSAAPTTKSHFTGRSEPSDRPVSTASGIISLYTDDTGTPLIDQTSHFASSPRQFLPSIKQSLDTKALYRITTAQHIVHRSEPAVRYPSHLHPAPWSTPASLVQVPLRKSPEHLRDPSPPPSATAPMVSIRTPLSRATSTASPRPRLLHSMVAARHAFRYPAQYCALFFVQLRCCALVEPVGQPIRHAKQLLRPSTLALHRHLARPLLFASA